jgi:ribosomal-protein-alanine N-acetyltransferase
VTDVPVFIDEAGPDDVPALLALERRCASHPWTERDFLSEMDGGQQARTLTARAPDLHGAPRIVGFCAYRLIADEVHIHNLATGPEHRRRGLARRLLRTVWDVAARAGARWALLEVRAGNLAARSLYESEGFVMAGRRRDYYAAPVEDALVLRRAL